MKRFVLPLLLLSGCAPSTHRAQDAVAAYLRRTMKIPANYVPISFGEPRAKAGRGDTVVFNHVYQGRTSADSVVIYSQLFEVDSLSGYAKPAKP